MVYPSVCLTGCLVMLSAGQDSCWGWFWQCCMRQRWQGVHIVFALFSWSDVKMTPPRTCLRWMQIRTRFVDFGRSGQNKQQTNKLVDLKIRTYLCMTKHVSVPYQPAHPENKNDWTCLQLRTVGYGNSIETNQNQSSRRIEFNICLVGSCHNTAFFKKKTKNPHIYVIVRAAVQTFGCFGNFA